MERGPDSCSQGIGAYTASIIPQALGHCAIRASYDFLFNKVSRILAQLNAAKATNSLEGQSAKLPLSIFSSSTTSTSSPSAAPSTKTSTM